MADCCRPALMAAPGWLLRNRSGAYWPLWAPSCSKTDWKALGPPCHRQWLAIKTMQPGHACQGCWWTSVAEALGACLSRSPCAARCHASYSFTSAVHNHLVSIIVGLLWQRGRDAAAGAESAPRHMRPCQPQPSTSLPSGALSQQGSPQFSRSPLTCQTAGAAPTAHPGAKHRQQAPAELGLGGSASTAASMCLRKELTRSAGSTVISLGGHMLPAGAADMPGPSSIQAAW